jgi:hypothetical protein
MEYRIKSKESRIRPCLESWIWTLGSQHQQIMNQKLLSFLELLLSILSKFIVRKSERPESPKDEGVLNEIKNEFQS